MQHQQNNIALRPQKYYKNPFWYLCATMIFLGCILEPSTEYVSLFGYPIPEICYTKRFFDISCLGCGLTRSVVYTFHFDIATALQMHLGGIPISLGALFYTTQQIYITISHTK